ncbi:hypothetical protein PWT90_03250 [Aphanocladium album]|nr:hypothetical protein PWT90_03250 [Aphanocladium album]
MDRMRVLDQHIDRSLLPIEPTEAAKYQFIWDFSPRPKTCRSETAVAALGRRPREDDERTLTSVMTETRRGHYKKDLEAESGSRGGGGGGGLLSLMLRSVKGPRKQMKRLLQTREKTPAVPTEKPHDGLRRSSEATLVERLSGKEEKKEKKK